MFKRKWAVGAVGALVAAAICGLLLAGAARGQTAQPEKKPPSPQEVAKLFAELVKKPTRESYLALYKIVTSSEKYEPYGTALEDAEDLLEKGELKQAKAKLDAAGLNLLLCPRAHQCAARIAKALGDAAAARKESAAAAACLKGILATGDGSPEKPYLVTRVSDEYDVLVHLKKRSTQQGLMNRGGKSFDVLSCTDGSQLWFDVTAMFGS